MTAARGARPFRLRDYTFAHGMRCPRCERRLRVRRGFRHWKLVCGIWLGVLALSLPLQALLAPIACVTWPLWAAIALAIGPLASLARRGNCCSECGLGVDSRSLMQPLAAAAAPGRDAIVISLERHWRARRRRV